MGESFRIGIVCHPGTLKPTFLCVRNMKIQVFPIANNWYSCNKKLFPTLNLEKQSFRASLNFPKCPGVTFFINGFKTPVKN